MDLCQKIINSENEFMVIVLIPWYGGTQTTNQTIPRKSQERRKLRKEEAVRKLRIPMAATLEVEFGERKAAARLHKKIGYIY